jgi:hypothetical protein
MVEFHLIHHPPLQVEADKRELAPFEEKVSKSVTFELELEFALGIEVLAMV